MKHKLEDGTHKKCDKCKTEITTNICESHKHEEECYKCHLLAEHIVVEDQQKEAEKK